MAVIVTWLANPSGWQSIINTNNRLYVIQLGRKSHLLILKEYLRITRRVAAKPATIGLLGIHLNRPQLRSGRPANLSHGTLEITTLSLDGCLHEGTRSVVACAQLLEAAKVLPRSCAHKAHTFANDCNYIPEDISASPLSGRRSRAVDNSSI